MVTSSVYKAVLVINHRVIRNVGSEGNTEHIPHCVITDYVTIHYAFYDDTITFSDKYNSRIKGSKDM
jgi:hypothetical protein